jgi:hypothetical protein
MNLAHRLAVTELRYLAVIHIVQTMKMNIIIG